MKATHATPQQLFETALYAPLPWPWKTTRLERSSVLDLTNRPISGEVSLNELYHENSKLFPEMLDEIAASRVDVNEVRREFVRRRARSMRTAVPEDWPDESVRGLFAALTASVDPELFYAVDLRVPVPGFVLFHEPVENVLLKSTLLDDGDAHALGAAVALSGSAESAADADAFLVIVGSFARNELLFGVRGYRQTLIEAGRLIQEVFRATHANRLTGRLVETFVDREVDRLIGADGVEEGVLAVVEVRSER